MGHHVTQALKEETEARKLQAVLECLNQQVHLWMKTDFSPTGVQTENNKEH